MRLIQLTPLALALLLAAPARAEVPYHKVVGIAPEKANGKVVGARVTVTVHPTMQGFATTRIGLVRAADITKVTRETAGSGEGLVFQAPAITDMKLNVPVEQTFVVHYGETLHSGDKLRVLSAWPTGNTHHVFGAVTQTSDTANEVSLP
jgi:hypothetical protein